MLVNATSSLYQFPATRVTAPEDVPSRVAVPALIFPCDWMLKVRAGWAVTLIRADMKELRVSPLRRLGRLRNPIWRGRLLLLGALIFTIAEHLKTAPAR